MSTKSNFLFAFIAFAALIGAVIWQGARTKDCTGASNTFLVLVDLTDELSDNAVATAKEHIWQMIQAAPAFTRIIVKEIRGANTDGTQTAARVEEACRPETLDFTTQFKGATKPVEREWFELQDWFCGQGPEGEPLACNSTRRTRSGILDRSSMPSASSPILETIVDASREYITTRAQSWTVVVLTDWRQYGSSLDLHVTKCHQQPKPDFRSVDYLADPKYRAFRVIGTHPRQSEFISMFALRESMTGEEANCLQDFAHRFILSQIESNPQIAEPQFIRLPKSPQ
jgi:hypothetical protein